MITQDVMTRIVNSQLSLDMNCAPEDFERDGFLFTTVRDHPGRRPFPRGERHFEMLTRGRGIVVCASEDLLPALRESLEDASRDDAFSRPFVYGHSLYYLPDLSAIDSCPFPEGLEYDLVEWGGMEQLYRFQGFPNALSYDWRHIRPDVLAVAAKDGGFVVGVAGASADCERMWQVGIDVLPAYRGRGIAAALVNRLTREILSRGIIPYYGTASSNIASQRVAHRAGYAPAWICAYRGRFGDGFTAPTS